MITLIIVMEIAILIAVPYFFYQLYYRIPKRYDQIRLAIVTDYIQGLMNIGMTEEEAIAHCRRTEWEPSIRNGIISYLDRYVAGERPSDKVMEDLHKTRFLTNV